MDSSASHCKRLVVAAFDLGTTFSGYAFSFQNKPLDIKANQCWAAGSQQLISLKTSTCVLLKPNKEFHSFGYEAENMYSELAEEKRHHDWYLFRRFKMVLYDTKELSMDITVTDITGKKMPALTIFAHSIRYLNSHLLRTLNIQTIGVEPEDIEYILTVPAIWDQKAKQFMRKVANEAGIKDDQLRIALEPEAASIWCQVATEDDLSGLAKTGSKYMVVDLGGGTADITIHERMKDGKLKELHKATGGSWGGIQVDNTYEEMISNVVGKDVMQQFKKEHVGDYLELMRDFETKKRTINTDTEGIMTFKIPAELKDCAEHRRKMKMQKLIESSQYRVRMKWAKDKLRVEKILTRSLFDKTLDKLTKHVEELLSSPVVSEIDAILLVGGFGESELVKEVFRKKCANKKLLSPNDAGLAVLKGSVIFGHMPEIVSVRVARFTYGESILEPFDKTRHDQTKKKMFHGREVCCDLFCRMVKIGEEISCGTEVVNERTPISVCQKSVKINIYSSLQEQPKYVTDKGCTFLGSITVNLPESDNIDDKRYKVYFAFGNTELEVKVEIIKTKKIYKTAIDCF